MWPFKAKTVKINNNFQSIEYFDKSSYISISTRFMYMQSFTYEQYNLNILFLESDMVTQGSRLVIVYGVNITWIPKIWKGVYTLKNIGSIQLLPCILYGLVRLHIILFLLYGLCIRSSKLLFVYNSGIMRALDSCVKLSSIWSWIQIFCNLRSIIGFTVWLHNLETRDNAIIVCIPQKSKICGIPLVYDSNFDNICIILTHYNNNNNQFYTFEELKWQACHFAHFLIQNSNSLRSYTA